MSPDETPKDESGGLSNEPLPGSGGPQGQPPEQPAAPPSQPPAPPSQPPAAPAPAGAGMPAPPPPPAPPAPGAPAPGAPVAPAGPGQSGLAIASFVCGILAILTSWCCGIGLLPGIAAVVCGLLAKGDTERRGAPNWMWITGTVLGAIAIVLVLAGFIIWGVNISTNPSWDTSTS